MAYEVLARKWRPQDFSSVVGQEPIVTALRNALTEGRIAQAYLFSGIRGVGKTSVARILAKALNCEKGPAADPCNECLPCREITRGSDLDALEVDAATYSKVEQVRELTESLKYGPARDRYKVVVIDEIHRLSRQAFDALLKIVEEPPPHLVFIFATTEAESVPATILSRCQEFRFRRVPARTLGEHLRRLADAEKIEVGDSALRLIARAGDGSVRDAVALLDQLATYGSGSIPDEEAARVLGGVDHAIFRRLLEAIVAGRPDEVSGVVGEVEAQGWDPRRAYADFLAYCRDALHLSLGAEADLPQDEAEALAELSKETGYENLLRLLNQLLAAESVVRFSESGALALEIAWLRAAELPKLVRVEELLAGGTGGGGEKPRPKKPAPPAPARRDEPPPAPEEGRLFRAAADDAASEDAPPAKRRRESAADAGRAPGAESPGIDAVTPRAEPSAGPAAGSSPAPLAEPPAGPPAAAPSARRAPAAEPRQEADPRTAPPPAPDPPPPAEEAPPPAPDPPPPAAAGTTPGGDALGRFLEEISRRRQSLAAHIREAHELAFCDGVLEIHAPPGDPWLNDDLLRRGKNRAAIDSALAAIWGDGARWKLVACERPAASRESRRDEAVEDARKDPRVQAVLDIFGGTVESVQETGTGGEAR